LAAGKTHTGTAGTNAAALTDDAEGVGELAAAAALPQHVVEALLFERYSRKYARLGVPHKLPGRHKWLRMQAEAAAAAAEAAATAAEEARLVDITGAAVAASAASAVPIAGAAMDVGAAGSLVAAPAGASAPAQPTAAVGGDAVIAAVGAVKAT
jgi:hypothetical protein